MPDVERIGVQEAQRRLDAGHTYLDVRTPEEFAAGHPVGARNVPFMVRVDGRLTPNADFLAVVQAAVPVESELVVGCATGQRSLMAARQLIDAGYAHVVDFRAGYRGVRDPFGQVIEKGWAASGLPTEIGE